MTNKMKAIVILLLAGMLLSLPAVAQQGIPAVTVTNNGDGTQDYTMTLQALFIMTALSLIPAFIMMMTSFTRIIVVLSILRQAIGLQQSPSNQILVGVSLFLSLFIMTPVFDEINVRALQPYLDEEMTSMEAFEQAKGPMRAFMLSQTRVKDLETFVSIAGEEDKYADPTEVPLNILIPAFVTSELKTAFQIGFMLFIPFQQRPLGSSGQTPIPKLVARVPKIRFQPSTSTNNISLKGNDTIIGDSIIIPIDIRIEATTRSIIKNGINSIKPI